MDFSLVLLILKDYQRHVVIASHFPRATKSWHIVGAY